MNIVNPATGQSFTSLEEDNKASIEAKMALLKRGQQKWRDVPIPERLQAIERFGELVLTNIEELAEILTKETGKPITQSRNEINGTMGRITHLQANAVKWLTAESMVEEGATRELITFEALGVIANISAWNFPYNVGFNVFLYALVGGNAVCYKPSEYASLTGMKFMELLHESGIPEDVFQVVIGKGDVGQLLLEMPFDGYFFTGSYQTGVHIAKAVAHKLVPVQLELGGKDPLYVMDDIDDVKQAAINAAEGAFYNNGQSCCAVERIYVHEGIYEDFVQHFVEEVKSYKMGDPMEATTFIGPMTRAAQLNIIEQQVKDATNKGAKLILGGKLADHQGYYLQPTVLTDVNHSMTVMMEESFGPVIGIQKVSSDEEALNLMQDTTYGLTGAIFSKEEARARKLLAQLNVGTAYWNCCDRVSPNLPWSGRKNSGVGSTLSYMGIRAFVQPKGYHLRG